MSFSRYHCISARWWSREGRRIEEEVGEDGRKVGRKEKGRRKER